jgi:outer membrane protein
MNKFFIIIFFTAAFSFSQAFAQQTKTLSLQEVVDMARGQSLSAHQASTLLENKYWQYRTFRSNYYPQLTFNATLPDYTRSIQPVPQNDGSLAFRGVSNMRSSGGLVLSQNIPWTGGQVFVNSQIQRIDNFASLDTTKSGATSYNSTPVIIGISQPLFGFNGFKWERKIEPLKYEESQREYVEELEQISTEAVGHYFDLLLAQIQMRIAQKNVANTDTLYRIAQGRYNLGKIAENELLQLELSLMNSKQDVARAQLDMEVSTLKLKTFLGLSDDADLQLSLPELIPAFEVDEQVALEEAKKNRQAVLSFKRQKLEAERNLAQAKGEAGLNANLYASFGLTQQADQVPDLYVNPQDQQSVRVGLEIPLLDWGRNRSKVKTAQANAELVRANVKQLEENFHREVFLQVKQFEMLKSQLVVAKKSDQIAEKRYEIAKNRYMIGKIAITDLNIATNEKDQAKRAYVHSLNDFWRAYYRLRQLTLYDFEKQETISIDFAEMAF